MTSMLPALRAAKRRRAYSGSLLALSIAAATVPANASTVIFSEDFSGATPAANYNSTIAGTQVEVTSGQVDILGSLNGSFAGCVVPAGGNCLDLVGSPGLGTVRSIPTFNLVAGDTYTITFGYILQGFATGTAPTSDFTVGFGSFSEQLTSIPMAQGASIAFTPSASQSGAFLSLAALNSPDIFHGPVISDIGITDTPGSGGSPVPEPASLALFVSALAGLGVLRLRRNTSA